MDYEISRASNVDLGRILDIQKMAFMEVAKLLNRFDLQPLLQDLDALCLDYEKGVVLKAVQGDGRIIGSVRAFLDGNGVCQIGKLVVDPTFQRRGVGRALMQKVPCYFGGCQKFSLFTGEVTPNTRDLYESLGYQVVACKQVDGIKMLFMEKAIA